VGSHTNSELGKLEMVMKPCQTLKGKLPKYVGLAQANSFDTANVDILQWLVKGAAMMCTFRKE
jgi:hypothetical protein